MARKKKGGVANFGNKRRVFTKGGGSKQVSKPKPATGTGRKSSKS